ncbi:MAG: TonB family protein [Opitutus sp.]
MTPPTKLFVALVLSACCALRATAEFKTLQIVPTFKPTLSPVMLMDGVTEGKVIFAIDVSDEGKITDTIVLGTTHRGMVRIGREILDGAEITPAQLNGQPVACQTEVTIDYHASGVVISRPAIIDLDQHVQQRMGYRMKLNQKFARDLDVLPPRLVTVMPKYGVDAEKQGVRGKVRVHFYIDETGAVRMPSVEGEAHPYLSAIALEAMRGWRFAPPMSHGKPALMAARQDFSFSR